MSQMSIRQPAWIRSLLIAAVVYHVMVGLLLLTRPATFFDFAGLAAPEYPATMQLVGAFYLVLAVSFALAVAQPLQRWTLVLLGFVAKVSVPAVLMVGVLLRSSPTAWLWLAASDLLWCVPLGAILYVTWFYLSDTSADALDATLETLMQSHTSQRGASITELSAERPLLLVFARHSGCTFCREMLSDLSKQRARLEVLGVEIGVVHMSSPLEAAQLAIRYALDGVHLFEDRECELYEAFGLKRGSVLQLFGPKVWLRGMWAGIVDGHGLGKIQGDGFRLQGGFIIQGGEIVSACHARTAADQIDFVALAKASRQVA